MKRNLHEDRLNSFFDTFSNEVKMIQATEPSRAFALDRQVHRAKKRARYHAPHLREQAVSSFIETNSLVGNKVVTLDPRIAANARYYITVILERFTRTFDSEAIQTPLELSYLFDNWRFGPGASNGVKGTHTAQKIDQSMTCTASCAPFVRKLRLNPYFQCFDARNGNDGTTLVNGSRLTTVPKNQDVERTIAIEPSGNMCLQLAAGMYLQGALRLAGLDISSQQPKNKAMALSGSLDGSFATIDLKSASDMMSLDLVRLLMPPDWNDLLNCLRSEFIELPDGTNLRLNMISTMGNGFTFPLMTLLLTSLIYGYRCTKGGPNLFIDWTRTCVFGDDIIVKNNEYEGVCAVLESAGFVVNHDKSFHEGPFRESCGGDYYEGVDVTPFYVKSLSNDSAVYVVINQVLVWSARFNVLPFDTLKLLYSYIAGPVHLVPEWLNPDQGVLTAQCPRRYKYLSLSQPVVRLENTHFSMMLAIGGYLEASGPDLFYTPRSASSQVRVRKSRIPKGYLDGADPLSREASLTWKIATIVAMTLG